MRRVAVLLLALLALAAAAPALASEQHPTQAELEAALICPTCHVPLDESNAPIAEQMKQQIRIWIADGWTRSRIMNTFVAQFGKGVLATPQTHGFDLVAWVLPLGGIGLGALGLGAGAWYWSRSRASGQAAPEAASEAPLDPELDRRVDEELSRFDG
jgi:cytochrome c-type biogenesis protein CcmH